MPGLTGQGSAEAAAESGAPPSASSTPTPAPASASALSPAPAHAQARAHTPPPPATPTKAAADPPAQTPAQVQVQTQSGAAGTPSSANGGGGGKHYKKYSTISGLSQLSGNSLASASGAPPSGAPGAGAGVGTTSHAAAAPTISKRASVRGLFDGLLVGHHSSSSSGGASGAGGVSADSSSGFGAGLGSGFSASSPSKKLLGSGASPAAAGAAARQDGPWSISVAQAPPAAPAPAPAPAPEGSKPKKSRRSSPWNAFASGGSGGGKASAAAAADKAASSSGGGSSSGSGGDTYTLYISTPTHNLTLTRSAAQIAALDRKLREAAPGAIPPLPRLNTGDAGAGAGGVNASDGAAQTGSRKLLQTISRTLSPGGNRTRTALSNLAGGSNNAHGNASGSGNADAPPASSSALNGALLKAPKAVPAAVERDISDLLASPDMVASPPLQPGADGRPPQLTSSHAPTTHIATYLTAIANVPAVKRHAAWKRFTRVEADDLQSVRVERRIKKVRSDLAKHVKSNVAPKNTNIAHHGADTDHDHDQDQEHEHEHEHEQDPSHSDLGEDDARLGVKRHGATASAGRLTDDDRGSVLSARSRDGGGGAPGASTSAVSSVEALAPSAAAAGAAGATLSAAAIAARRRSAGTTASAGSSTPDALAPDVPSRTGSIGSAGGAQPNAAAARSFVSIPEEGEVAKSSSGAGLASGEVGAAPDGGGGSSQHGRETSTGAASSSVSHGGHASGASGASAHDASTTGTTVATAASASASASASSGGHGEGARELREKEREREREREREARKKARESRNSRRDRDKVTVDDFEMIRVLGKGCAGKVLLVRHTASRGLFAMKSIHKRHVLAHQELQHTLTEQSVLKRMAKDVNDPFVVKLWWSFHDRANLYLVMDFHPGGDLATQLSRWGRLGRDRARFYAAEIVEGVEGLHKAGVIYRDLKPENVLIGNDGHIVLSDFGLSKEFPQEQEEVSNGRSTPPTSPLRSHSSSSIKAKPPHWMGGADDSATGRSSLSARWSDQRDTTTTFCGTAEYLAPEVIQGVAYSYEVDWWSFGTMLYEMLTGITPFWADTHADMYVRVLHDELVFPEDRVLDTDTKSILRGLLQRNPILRMKEPRIKKHPYFSMIEWAHVFHKRYIPPYIPPINPLDETDTQNFDEAFLDMQPTVTNAVEEDAAEEEAAAQAELEKAKRLAEEKRAAEALAGRHIDAEEKSLFDGYSFRGRRDSESVKSTIMSISSSGQVASSEPGDATDATSPPAAAESSPKPPSSAGTRTLAGADDSEDDEAAARAAVAALAHLEREASGELLGVDAEQAPSTPSKDTPAPQISSAAATKDGAAAKSRAQAAAPLVESDEDDDWDMIDGTEGPLQSEMNGGKGQNLFARGVVDTYRLLRRQEPLRQPTSPGARALNRLSRRQASNGDARRRRPDNKSTSQLRSPSRGSGSSDNLTPNRASDASPSLAKVSGEEEESRSGDVSMTKTDETRLAPTNNATAKSQDTRKSVGASVTSSDDVLEKVKPPKNKRMKRFTTFFTEAASKFD